MLFLVGRVVEADCDGSRPDGMLEQALAVALQTLGCMAIGSWQLALIGGSLAVSSFDRHLCLKA